MIRVMRRAGCVTPVEEKLYPHMDALFGFTR
jgi:hypothetical protein